VRQRRTIALISFAALAAAILVRWLLDPYLRDNPPFVTLMGAIAVAVWYGGWRPAAIVALLGWVVGSYLFVDPRGSLMFGDPRNVLRLVGYLVTAAIVIGLGEALHASQRRLADLATRVGGAESRPEAALAPGTAPPAPAARPPRDLAVPAFGLTLLVLLVGGSLGY
jgi:K+-sensing histidine kinase KdpD